MTAVRSSSGSTRLPETNSTPLSITASTLSGSTPGSAKKIKTSVSVSSTSTGGCQDGPPICWLSVKNCWCRRCARESRSTASNHIQRLNSLLAMGSHFPSRLRQEPCQRMPPLAVHTELNFVTGYMAGSGGTFQGFVVNKLRGSCGAPAREQGAGAAFFSTMRCGSCRGRIAAPVHQWLVAFAIQAFWPAAISASLILRV